MSFLNSLMLSHFLMEQSIAEELKKINPKCSLKLMTPMLGSLSDMV